MSDFYKRGLLVAMSMLMICGLTGCSSNDDNSKKEDSTKVEDNSSNGSSKVDVKEIPANLLKDFEVTYQVSEKISDNKSLGSFNYNAMRNLDSLNFYNDFGFAYDDTANSEYQQGEFLFFRGENAKKFIIEHFEEYGYDSKYVDDYVSELNMKIDDLCFFLLRTNSVLKDSKEMFDEGKFEDSYMMGFITENDHSLNIDNMVTHDMYSYQIK